MEKILQSWKTGSCIERQLLTSQQEAVHAWLRPNHMALLTYSSAKPPKWWNDGMKSKASWDWSSKMQTSPPIARFMEIQQKDNETLAAYINCFKTAAKWCAFDNETAAICIFVKGLGDVPTVAWKIYEKDRHHYEALWLGKKWDKLTPWCMNNPQQPLQLISTYHCSVQRRWWKCLVINYGALNKVTRKFVWCMPRVEDIFSRMNAAKYFSTLDLHAGYHHIHLDEESIPKAAFTSPFGKYEY